MSDTIAVPSLDEGQKLLTRFAKLSAAAAGHEAELAAAIAPLKASADKKLAPIAAELDGLKEKLEPWWHAHGATLTKGKKKSHELNGCVIGTKLNPKKLVFAGLDGGATDDETAIAVLRGAKLIKLVKKVFQLDRKAIQARLEAEPNGAVAELGFSITQAESFFVDLATRARKA